MIGENDLEELSWIYIQNLQLCGVCQFLFQWYSNEREHIWGQPTEFQYKITGFLRQMLRQYVQYFIFKSLINCLKLYHPFIAIKITRCSRSLLFNLPNLLLPLLINIYILLISI